MTDKKENKNVNIKVTLPKELPEEEALKEEDLDKVAGGMCLSQTSAGCPKFRNA